MKKSLQFSLFLLIAASTFQGMYAQNLVVKFQDATEQSEQLSSLRTITFNSGSLVLNFNLGAKQSFGLSSINKLLFQSGTSAVEHVSMSDDEEVLSIWFNQSDKRVYLKSSVEIDSQVKIYSINGAMVMCTQIHAGSQSIDVSVLPNGFYLLNANNKTLKFVKR